MGSYRTSLPLHKTEWPRKKRATLQGQDTGKVKKGLGGKTARVLEDTGDHKAGDKIKGIKKKHMSKAGYLRDENYTTRQTGKRRHRIVKK